MVPLPTMLDHIVLASMVYVFRPQSVSSADRRAGRMREHIDFESKVFDRRRTYPVFDHEDVRT